MAMKKVRTFECFDYTLAVRVLSLDLCLRSMKTVSVIAVCHNLCWISIYWITGPRLALCVQVSSYVRMYKLGITFSKMFVKWCLVRWFRVKDGQSHGQLGSGPAKMCGLTGREYGQNTPILQKCYISQNIPLLEWTVHDVNRHCLCYCEELAVYLTVDTNKNCRRRFYHWA